MADVSQASQAVWRLVATGLKEVEPLRNMFTTLVSGCGSVHDHMYRIERDYAKLMAFDLIFFPQMGNNRRKDRRDS